MLLTGLLGYPLGHTLSPRMHQAAFVHAGLHGLYVPFAVPPARLADAVHGLAPLGVHGCNVTIPHKQSVVRYVRRATPAVRQIGAANTLCWDGDGWVAHNTDVMGFLRAWQAEVGVPIEGKRFLLLGSGGAARALLYALLASGAGHVTVAARREHLAGRLCLDLGADRTTPAGLGDVLGERELDGLDGVLNATPVGMAGHETRSPVTFAANASHLVAWDAIYNPAVTPFMQAAQAAGARAVNGLHMLAGQAREAFRLWTGHEVPVQVFLDAVQST